MLYHQYDVLLNNVFDIQVSFTSLLNNNAVKNLKLLIFFNYSFVLDFIS